MDLEFSDDQRMLKDTVDRFVADRYGFEQRLAIVRGPDGWSREIWSELAELGLLMIPVAEADGGLAGGGVAAMIVGESVGRALLVEPYLPCVIMAAAALATASEDARGDLLPGLMDGSRRITVVGGDDLRLADGRVTGAARVVLGGDAADTLLVFARDARDDLHLVSLPIGAEIARESYALQGGGGAADLRFSDAPVRHEIAGPNNAAAVRARVDGAALAFVAAEALGAAQAAFDLTIEYAKTRVQFGKAIGTNQAIQHRAAEMLVELEQLRSAAMYAAVMVDEPDQTERARALAAVQIVVAKSSRFIAQQAVQLHGGIGVTDEYAVSHYFKRLTAIGILFGDAAQHLSTLAESGGFLGDGAYWPTMATADSNRL